jgi:Skp family chaperone for outer membrane proteins
VPTLTRTGAGAVPTLCLTCHIAVAFLIGSVSLIGGQRAIADPAAPTFGSVDLQKIQDGYAKRDDLDKSIQAVGNDLQTRFTEQQNSAMLSTDDQEKLGAVLAKAAADRTDADRAAITQLETKSSQDAQELAGLQQKASLTDADKARLTTLTAEQQAGKQAIQQVHDEYMDLIKKQQDKVAGDFTALVKSAIAEVAKDRGLSIVFDSTLAIYCANDITDDVLKKLNK